MAAGKTSDGASLENEVAATEIEEAGAPAAAGFPIVGIGASAGGLAAFEAFFCAMPPDSHSGMAFVLVQHLAPDHKSLLTDLIQRYTRMDVFEVEDGMEVRPNCAYIIPPNRDMAFVNGSLQLSTPAAPRGHRLPIDFFFRSLARDRRERAICIVLSGSGSDGTLGLRAIKGEGGMVMAQNPESTEYDSMPRSAIATGLVDYVLPPAEMPRELFAYAVRACGPPRPATAPATSKAEDELKVVFDLLRTQTGHDFSQYKPNTIVRRIERRMAIHQIEHLQDYVGHLRATPTEIDALFRDLLIGVTSFFRDPEAFQALATQVIPLLLADRRADSAVRVWVPGCSTGEEAYSIAMLLRETLQAQKKNHKVQVFATDIDTRAIQTARAAIYPASIAADVASERLTRHFSQMDDGNYCIHKSIRELLIFSEQDVAKDPPFSKLDFISCRNLMIYMGVDLQKRLIPLFHYALKPAGALFLGTSETVGDFGQLFSTIDRKAKLYRRRDDVPGTARPAFGIARAPIQTDEPHASPRSLAAETRRPYRELTEGTLLEDAPVAALVNERGEVRVDVTVRPVSAGVETSAESHVFLVTFAPSPPSRRNATDENGAATHEEMQTSNEDLKSANEELQSTNEELQSANEELETSKEEFQSLNEELATVNAELQSKVSDLSRVNNDMNNLLAGTGIGTVFVDQQLCIRRFTPEISEFINLIQTDVGRPLSHIVSNLASYDGLVADVQGVLDTLVPMDLDVRTRSGAAYVLRIIPYRTSQNVVEGAVITFTRGTTSRSAIEQRVTN